MALLVLDATEGVLALDATIAGYAHEEGRALSSASTSGTPPKRKGKRKFQERSRITEVSGLCSGRVHFGQGAQGMRSLFGLIRKAFDSASRIGTGELNRFVDTLDGNTT